MVCRSIPYKEGFGAKQLAWMAYGGVMGAVVAPMTLMGGPLLMRAAWYTAGVVGGKYEEQQKTNGSGFICEAKKKICVVPDLP